MTNLLNSKRGVFMNIVAGIIFLFIFGYLIVFTYTYITEYKNAVIDTGLSVEDVEPVAESFLFGIRLFDWLAILVLAALVLGVGVTSYKVASAPVFFVVMIVSGAMLGFISYFFNFVFSEFVSDVVFSSTIVYFPRLIIICTNLHWVALAMFAVGSITMYGKRERGQFV